MFTVFKSPIGKSPIGLLAAGALAISVATLAFAGQSHGNNVNKVPAYDGAASTEANKLGQAVLAGGCFWGLEMVFQHVEGVKRVVSGYAGGSKQTASYAEVGTGRTGHAESVHIFYDPSQVDYATLLRVYFSVAHDPTQVNQQWPDIGSEYRSVIFALSPAQRQIAKRYIAQVDSADVFNESIATEVSVIGSSEFYPAEDYHQNYGLKHPKAGYIQRFDQPKVVNLKKYFSAIYRNQSVAASEVS